MVPPVRSQQPPSEKVVCIIGHLLSWPMSVSLLIDENMISQTIIFAAVTIESPLLML